MLSLSLLTPLHAEVQADCSAVERAISSRISAEQRRVDDVSQSIVADVERSRSCVDGVLENINGVIGNSGDTGIFGGILQSAVSSLAGQACQLIQGATASIPTTLPTFQMPTAASVTNQVVQTITGTQGPTPVTGIAGAVVNQVTSQVTSGGAGGGQTPPPTLWQRVLNSVW